MLSVLSKDTRCSSNTFVAAHELKDDPYHVIVLPRDIETFLKYKT